MPAVDYVFPREQMAAAVAASTGYRSVMKALGAPTSGNGYIRIRKALDAGGFDVSHFVRGDASRFPAGYVGSDRHKASLIKARETIGYGECRWCAARVHMASMPRHEHHCHLAPANLRLCPVCEGPIKGRGETCSKACANTHFRSGQNHPNWVNGKDYRRICFAHHPHRCAVCSETLLLEVHHFDENHDNDVPENLVPLCATHHQYWHSRHRHLVEEVIVKYVDDFVAARQEDPQPRPRFLGVEEPRTLPASEAGDAGAEPAAQTTFSRLTLPPADVGFLAMRSRLEADMARVFGVPSRLLTTTR